MMGVILADFYAIDTASISKLDWHMQNVFLDGFGHAPICATQAAGLQRPDPFSLSRVSFQQYCCSHSR